MDTGSNWMLVGSPGPKVAGSVTAQRAKEWRSSKEAGSVAAQRAKEWRSLKEAGRQSISGTVKMLQKRWNLWIPKP